jgi:hypothetical protein
MDISAQPPGSVVGYARALTGQVLVVTDGVLQAAYLHGSAVLAAGCQAAVTWTSCSWLRMTSAARL